MRRKLPPATDSAFMSLPASTVRRPARQVRPHARCQPEESGSSGSTASRTVYGRSFWLAYSSNALLLVGVALLFRYADLVNLLGGTEFHLGWIVGIGTFGSLFTRLLIGSWLDRYGTRMLWIGSALLLSVTCFAHLTVRSQIGSSIYVLFFLRIVYCCAVAGANGASMTFIAKLGPTARLAELVGMLGTAGFLGSVIGAFLGDLLAAVFAVPAQHVASIFIAAALLALGSVPLAWAATREERAPAKSGNRPASVKPSAWSLLRRHHPGVVLAVGVAMGIGLGLPATYLRTYAADLGIERIGLFFMIYAIAAIITRIVARRWAERFGPQRIILIGCAGMTASLLLFLPVQTEWHLILPAIGYGCSHALLFPAVVAAGSVTFPLANRGLATLLVLAAWDAGTLIGAPTAGAIIRLSRRLGLPPYPTMFITIATLLTLITAWYAVRSRQRFAGIADARPTPDLRKRTTGTLQEPIPVDFSAQSRSNIL